GRDRLEAPLHGLDRKRQVEDDGGDEKTLEREYELRAEHGMPNLPDRRSRAEGDKKIVAENGRWQHERERHERLDEALASESMVGQRSTSENADRQEDENRHHGKPKREGERHPVHLRRPHLWSRALRPAGGSHISGKLLALRALEHKRKSARQRALRISEGPCFAEVANAIPQGSTRSAPPPRNGEPMQWNRR